MKCCAKCRTPYNCGNKNCPCHGAPAPVVRLPGRSQVILRHADWVNDRRNPHVE